MKNIDLRPCPFCGAKNLHIDEPEYSDALHIPILGSVTCMACLASGPLGETVEEAVALWNGRVSPLMEVRIGEDGKIAEVREVGHGQG